MADKTYSVTITNADTDDALDCRTIAKILESRLILKGYYTAEVIVTEEDAD